MQDNPISLLDNIRSSNGNQDFESYCRRLLKEDRYKALELVNDPMLQFGTLYRLRHLLISMEFKDGIRPFYRDALEMTGQLLNKRNGNRGTLLRQDNEASAATLRWMVTTGCREDTLGKDYDQLMERASALLTMQFGDPDVLPFLAERIFRLNRAGKPVHDLAWAFFEAKRPESLVLLAQRLDSNDGRDVALSKRLLCFIPFLENPVQPTGKSLYEQVAVWLQDNLPFLQYTGESLHLSGMPRHYCVAVSAKYLCRPVSAEDGEPLSEWNPFEIRLLKQFEEIPEATRSLLADFSFALYRRDYQQWDQWIQLPADSQTSLAERYLGGFS